MIEALETLKSIPNWVCYKNEIPKGGDKPAKLPKNPHSGGNAISTKSQTWSDFMTAVQARKRYSLDGLGWVFTEEAGIIGIDLDSCIDEAGQIMPWATKIMESIYSYTEISPSGKGVHIFAYAKIPNALGPTPESSVEMYAKGRYFTVTGKMLPGSFEKIAQRQSAIDNLWQTENERRHQKNKPQPALSSQKVTTPDKLNAYTEKAYLDEIATLSMATEGCRNDTLNRAAFNLGQFIEAKLLNQTEVEMTLFNIAIQLGLSDCEASATMGSGIKAGIANPRSWPDSEQPLQQDKENDRKPMPRNDLTYHDGVSPHLGVIFDRWGLTRETVESFKVGYCDTCPTSPYSASFTVPYYETGNLVDIRHRLLSPNGQGTYRPEVEGSPSFLFNLAAVQADMDDWVILVNREFNTMLLHQNLLPVIGLPSTFKTEWVENLKDLDRVYIALDPGQEEWARRIGMRLSGAGVDTRICSLPFSPRDMLVRYGCSLYEFFQFVEQGWGVS